jgi:hypothetical protein
VLSRLHAAHLMIANNSIQIGRVGGQQKSRSKSVVVIEEMNFKGPWNACVCVYRLLVVIH